MLTYFWNFIPSNKRQEMELMVFAVWQEGCYIVKKRTEERIRTSASWFIAQRINEQNQVKSMDGVSYFSLPVKVKPATMEEVRNGISPFAK